MNWFGKITNKTTKQYTRRNPLSASAVDSGKVKQLNFREQINAICHLSLLNKKSLWSFQQVNGKEHARSNVQYDGNISVNCEK